MKKFLFNYHIEHSISHKNTLLTGLSSKEGTYHIRWVIIFKIFIKVYKHIL